MAAVLNAGKKISVAINPKAIKINAAYSIKEITLLVLMVIDLE